MQHQTSQKKILRTICPDAKGLIAKITNICYKHQLNIVQNNEFWPTWMMHCRKAPHAN